MLPLDTFSVIGDYCAQLVMRISPVDLLYFLGSCPLVGRGGYTTMYMCVNVVSILLMNKVVCNN